MKAFFLIVFCFTNFLTFSQNCENLLIFKKGSIYEYAYFNSKNNLEHTSKMNVLDVKKDEKTWIANIEITSFDQKNKEFYKLKQEYQCQNNILTLDLSNLFDKKMLSEYENMHVQIESDKMEIPTILSIGEKLNNGTATINVNNEGINFLKMSISVNNRVVEGKEIITVPAGTFDCFVISYDIEYKSIFKSSGKMKEWHAKEVGLVKQESYNSKGKINGYTVLNNFKK